MSKRRGPIPIDPKVRFARFFDVVPTKCWEWRGRRFGSGYGQFYAGLDSAGKRMNIHAHRFAYELRFGPIPDGLQGLHHCDNPPVGDIVKVADRSGDGWNRVEVAAIVEQPPFATKPIIGKAPAIDEPAGIADQ